jgi:hypothetical protein
MSRLWRSGTATSLRWRNQGLKEIATCHGFFELGRFAGEYRSLFGEAPSETLNKAAEQGESAHEGGSPPTDGDLVVKNRVSS